MKKKLLTLLLFLFFTVDISTTSQANTDTIIIDGANKIIEGLGKIETATKGKKLQEFFSRNTLRLLIDGKTKEYKFQEKTYEVFEDGKSIESGKWKVSGLLKNQIKLNADNNSKAYYLKKINKKEILYHYDKAPGKEGRIKTLVTIESLIKKEESKVVKKKEETKKKKLKKVLKKEETKKKKLKKVLKKEETKKKKLKKVVKKQNSKNIGFKYSKLSEKQKKEFRKLEEEAKKLRIVESDNSHVETTKGKIKAGQFLAAKHCSKYSKFAYKFEDSSYGKWYEAFKRSTYFYCSDLLLYTNPFTNKQVTWTNYDDKNNYEFPNEHLYVYRKISNSYKKILKKETRENPKRFKSNTFRIIHKDKNSIHIYGNTLGDLVRERYVANEHCSQHNKKYYYFEDSIQRGRFGSMFFSCGSSHLSISPYGTSSPLVYVSGSENYSENGNNFNASQMLKYNVTSNTTYFYFESADSLMNSLKLLYLAYGENVKAEKLRAQIAYNKESKYSEADKLETTRTIVDSYSTGIISKINNESLTLDIKSKDFYYQSLPYALEAAKNVTSLILIINETFQEGTKDVDSLLNYSNEFIGLLSVSKDLPRLAKDIFKTTQLLFSAAKSKKIKDNEKYDKALNELDFEI